MEESKGNGKQGIDENIEKYRIKKMYKSLEDAKG
jgi:hypothetical protein